ncbi:protein regulator of cytokinesis 1-like [Drosophila kikkawai]|uniref:Protein regulator of cytokinesis 1-like n=1 Tax=Drosophila kikkawai TaxID=30033 RepID=A0A6P4J8T0_DROKI|nr:protein regulator of cytokinesis 1-like [Drosophila kikkawai]
METHHSTTVKDQILEMTGQHVDLLLAMWLRIFEPKTCDEFLLRLRDHVQTFYKDLLNESQEKQQSILDDIARLRMEASVLARLLHKSVDMHEQPDDLPLVMRQLELKKSIELLSAELASQRAEIGELLVQQNELCEELDELPLPLPADPLPLPEEMDAFRDHLQQLRDERVQRLKEVDELRDSIRTNMKILELFPITDSEVQLLCQDNQSPKNEVLTQLRLMQKEYAHQVEELHEHIDTMRKKIEVLWTRLPETEDFFKRRVREAMAYTQGTYDVLLEELQRCQAIRTGNLKTYIGRLRAEIKVWWDLTLKSPEERKLFTSYFTDTESEDILELHEMELDGLKDFYSRNKKLFELYAHRGELWMRMEALVAKANDPSRFNNRGGQLLKEEKERKAISAKLPKIEQQITELVNVYVSQVNTPFLVYGEDIHKSMALDWEQLRQPKQPPSAAKKPEPPSAPFKSKSQKKEALPSLTKTPANPGNANPLTDVGGKDSSNVLAVNSKLDFSLRRASLQSS